ncbi:hypothetical protein CYMTET_46892, partial [Cymbomonas tetramitiformis]
MAQDCSRNPVRVTALELYVLGIEPWSQRWHMPVPASSEEVLDELLAPGGALQQGIYREGFTCTPHVGLFDKVELKEVLGAHVLPEAAEELPRSSLFRDQPGNWESAREAAEAVLASIGQHDHGWLGEGHAWRAACGWAHGELRAENIMLDCTGAKWLINAACKEQRHVFSDLAHLEANLLFQCTPLVMSLEDIAGAGDVGHVAHWLGVPKDVAAIIHTYCVHEVGAAGATSPQVAPQARPRAQTTFGPVGAATDRLTALQGFLQSSVPFRYRQRIGSRLSASTTSPSLCLIQATQMTDVLLPSSREGLLQSARRNPAGMDRSLYTRALNAAAAVMSALRRNLLSFATFTEGLDMVADNYTFPDSHRGLDMIAIAYTVCLLVAIVPQLSTPELSPPQKRWALYSFLQLARGLETMVAAEFGVNDNRMNEGSKEGVLKKHRLRPLYALAPGQRVKVHCSIDWKATFDMQQTMSYGWRLATVTSYSTNDETTTFSEGDCIMPQYLIQTSHLLLPRYPCSMPHELLLEWERRAHATASQRVADSTACAPLDLSRAVRAVQLEHLAKAGDRDVPEDGPYATIRCLLKTFMGVKATKALKSSMQDDLAVEIHVGGKLLDYGTASLRLVRFHPEKPAAPDVPDPEESEAEQGLRPGFHLAPISKRDMQLGTLWSEAISEGDPGALPTSPLVDLPASPVDKPEEPEGPEEPGDPEGVQMEGESAESAAENCEGPRADLELVLTGFPGAIPVDGTADDVQGWLLLPLRTEEARECWIAGGHWTLRCTVPGLRDDNLIRFTCSAFGPYFCYRRGQRLCLPEPEGVLRVATIQGFDPSTGHFVVRRDAEEASVPLRTLGLQNHFAAPCHRYAPGHRLVLRRGAAWAEAVVVHTDSSAASSSEPDGRSVLQLRPGGAESAGQRQGDASKTFLADLNEFNHGMHLLDPMALKVVMNRYRRAELKRHAEMVDAITGAHLRILNNCANLRHFRHVDALERLWKHPASFDDEGKPWNVAMQEGDTLGISRFYRNWDRREEGVHNADTWLILASSAMGKSALLRQVHVACLLDKHTEFTPLMVDVATLARVLTTLAQERSDTSEDPQSDVDAGVFDRYLHAVYKDSSESSMLRQALSARRVLMLVDGMDQSRISGSGRRAVERYVLRYLTRQGFLILVALRPGGLDLTCLRETVRDDRWLFLMPPSPEQQQQIIAKRVTSEEKRAAVKASLAANVQFSRTPGMLSMLISTCQVVSQLPQDQNQLALLVLQTILLHTNFQKRGDMGALTTMAAVDESVPATKEAASRFRLLQKITFSTNPKTLLLQRVAFAASSRQLLYLPETVVLRELQTEGDRRRWREILEQVAAHNLPLLRFVTESLAVDGRYVICFVHSIFQDIFCSLEMLRRLQGSASECARLPSLADAQQNAMWHRALALSQRSVSTFFQQLAGHYMSATNGALASEGQMLDPAAMTEVFAPLMRHAENCHVIRVRDAAPGATAHEPLGVLASALRLRQFPHLASLHMENCSITSRGAAANTPLASLVLPHNSIGPSGLAALAGGLVTNTTLHTLQLGHNQVARKVPSETGAPVRPEGVSEGVGALGKALRVNRTLQHLDLQSNGIDAAGMVALAPGVAMSKALVHLNLSGNPFATEVSAGLLALVIALCPIGDLDDFRDTTVPTEVLGAARASVFQSGSRPHAGRKDPERLKGAAPRPYNTTLAELKLAERVIPLGLLRRSDASQMDFSCIPPQAQLRPADVVVISALLRGGSRITKFSLRGNLLCGRKVSEDLDASKASTEHPEALVALLYLLAKQPQLTELDLSFNKLGRVSVAALAAGLSVGPVFEWGWGAWPKGDRAVKHANAFGLHFPEDWNTKVEVELKRLDLSGNSLGEVGAKGVAKLLRMGPGTHLRDLVALKLDQNRLRPEGAAALCAVLGTRMNNTLRELSLAENELGGENGHAAHSLATMLRVNTSLRRLDLHGNHWLAADAVIITEAIRPMDHLEDA